MALFGGKKVEELEDKIEERLSRFERELSARITPLSDALKKIESSLAEIRALLGAISSQPESIRSRLAVFLERAEKGRTLLTWNCRTSAYHQASRY